MRGQLILNDEELIVCYNVTNETDLTVPAGATFPRIAFYNMDHILQHGHRAYIPTRLIRYPANISHNIAQLCYVHERI